MPPTLSPIIVASAVDRRFLPYAEVVAASIAASASGDRPIEYHILYAGPETWLVGHLRRFRRGPLTIHVHEVENPWERFGKINRFPPSSLLRFSLEDVLPAHVERVIYLDVDVIVQSDLGPLFDLPTNGHAVACAIDQGMSARMAPPGEPAELKYVRDTLELGDAATTYFQCGVMLLDLPALRRLGFKQKAAAALQRFGQTLMYADQCAANHVLKGDYQTIDPRWNVYSWSVSDVPDARIIHYADLKPWHWLQVKSADSWWRQARTLPTFPLFVWGYLRHRGSHEFHVLKSRVKRRLDRRSAKS